MMNIFSHSASIAFKHMYISLTAVIFFAGSFSATHAAVSTFQDGIVIGGSSLSSGLLLDVNGKIGASQYCNAGGGGCVSVGSIGSVWATSGNDIYNTNSANVGIGTSNPQHKLHTTGNIRADGRHIFLGSSQDIYGNNGSAIYYDSNHPSIAQIVLRDASNNVLGRLYGSSGDNIGFLDDQGQWAIRHNRDNYTLWQINNSEKMRLTPTGLGIGTTNPKEQLDVVGDISVSGFYNGTEDNIRFMNNRSDDGDYEWVGWYSGSSRAGIFLWDGAWSGCDADKFCIIGDTHQLMLKSKTGDVEVDDNLVITTPNQLRANNVCDANGNNCFNPAKVFYDDQNVGFDSYGSWSSNSLNSVGDTCNGNSYHAAYTCPVNASKTCVDEYSFRSGCGKGCNRTYYRNRSVTCVRERVMVNVQ
jgi:hypothetical protein